MVLDNLITNTYHHLKRATTKLGLGALLTLGAGNYAGCDGDITTEDRSCYSEIPSNLPGKIAFTSNRDGTEEDGHNYQVYIMKADGSEVSRLTTMRSGTPHGPKISPDGKDIIFEAEPNYGWEGYDPDPDVPDSKFYSGIYTTLMSGPSEYPYHMVDCSQLIEGMITRECMMFGPDWTPDGSSFFFRISDIHTGIYKTNNAVNYPDRMNGMTRVIERGSDVEVSPDGNSLAFNNTSLGMRESGEEYGDEYGDKDQIYISSIDGSNPVNITKHNSNNNNPHWSPDGEKIVFDSDRNFRDGHDLFVVDIETEHTYQLTTGIGSYYTADWSPDGQLIVFGANFGYGSDFYIIDAKEGCGKIRQLTDFPGNDFSPHWVP